jgi:DNA invertase Pin-like site-specific DNA recombinase
MQTSDVQKPGRIRASGYCRISSDPKDKREGVDRQRQDVTALCEVKGWQLAGFYIDNDRSASNGKDRPLWDRLLADIEAGTIDAIAAWDQDRGWRMMAELEELRKFFASLRRPVHLATTGQGDIDLFSPTGILAAQIKTAVSEHEIAMMRVRQRRAARQRAEQGRPKWRRAFGYLPYTGTKEDDKGLREPDPLTGPLVTEAYRAILAGASLSDVIAPWNAAGHYGMNGKPWTATTLSLFLRSPRNAGLRSHTDTATAKTEIVGQGTWTPLVDESLWRSVQHVLNAPGRAPGPKSVRKHLFTGLIRCGGCAAEGVDARLSGLWVMTPTGGKPGRPKAGQVKEPHPGQRSHKIAYACKRCRGCSIRAEQVEPIVNEAVLQWLSAEDAVDLLRVPAADPQEAQRITDERAVLHGRMNEIADERADGLLTGAQAKRATERIQEKLDALDRLQIDADRLRVLDGIPLGTAEVADALADLSDDRYRAVIDLLMTVTVQPVGKRGNIFRAERVKVDAR